MPAGDFGLLAPYGSKDVGVKEKSPAQLHQSMNL